MCRALQNVTPAGDPYTAGTDQTENVRTTEPGESTHAAQGGKPAGSLSYSEGSLVLIGLTTYDSKIQPSGPPFWFFTMEAL